VPVQQYGTGLIMNMFGKDVSGVLFVDLDELFGNQSETTI
jgi:hypothetical protein